MDYKEISRIYGDIIIRLTAMLGEQGLEEEKLESDPELARLIIEYKEVNQSREDN